MQRSLMGGLAGGLLVVIVVLAGRGCSRSPDDAGLTTIDPPGAQRNPAPQAGGAAPPDPAAALANRRHADMQEAVSTLHRYLAALGSGDVASSATYWAGGIVPRASGEADLRRRGALRSLRSKTGMPSALDDSVVPDALEIPVELRAAADGAPMQLYAGSYRLRRRVADGGWEITSAAINAREP